MTYLVLNYSYLCYYIRSKPLQIWDKEGMQLQRCHSFYFLFFLFNSKLEMVTTIWRKCTLYSSFTWYNFQISLVFGTLRKFCLIENSFQNIAKTQHHHLRILVVFMYNKRVPQCAAYFYNQQKLLVLERTRIL